MCVRTLHTNSFDGFVLFFIETFLRVLTRQFKINKFNRGELTVCGYIRIRTIWFAAAMNCNNNIIYYFVYAKRDLKNKYKIRKRTISSAKEEEEKTENKMRNIIFL